jgi:polyphosphate glucokinase
VTRKRDDPAEARDTPVDEAEVARAKVAAEAELVEAIEVAEVAVEAEVVEATEVADEAELVEATWLASDGAESPGADGPAEAPAAAGHEAVADHDDQDKAGVFTGDPIDPGHRRIAIGVDVGGSGIKAAAVDLDTGEIVGLRHRVPTPQPSTPAAVVASISRLVKKIGREVKLEADTPVGVGFPTVVIDGVTMTAANVDQGWKGFEADAALERVLGRPVHLVNDADAAGVAEMRFGAGAGRRGTVFLITLGTGTGSALFWNGTLVPNLELGHMEIRGRDAERRSAAAARLRRGISWKAWATDLDEHLLAIEKLFSPKLFIIGGGVSKRADLFIPRLTVRAEVVPAKLRNDAGIVGAAMAASEAETAAAAEADTMAAG